MGFGWITDIFKPLASIANKWQDGRQKQAERTDRIKEAECVGRIALLTKYADGDIDADLAAVNQMKNSWKDEYLTIAITFPFLYSFIDVIVSGGTVAAAWTAVGLAPTWYQWCFEGIIISTFGLRAMYARRAKTNV